MDDNENNSTNSSQYFQLSVYNGVNIYIRMTSVKQ